MNTTCPLCGEPATATEIVTGLGASVQVIGCPCVPSGARFFPTFSLKLKALWDEALEGQPLKPSPFVQRMLGGAR